MRLVGIALFSAVLALPLQAVVPNISPTEAAKLVTEGKALLVDVREPAEWEQTGVAAPAILLPKSDFDGPQQQWKPFLHELRGKRVVLYCRTGHRAGIVGAALAAKGVDVVNAGGLKDWVAAGLPVRSIPHASDGTAPASPPPR